MSKFMFEKFAFYGLGIDLESEPELAKSRNQNRNHNVCNVGNGTGTINFLDANIDLLKLDSNSSANYLNRCLSAGYLQCINKATRF
jgi:hypothetical protein